MRRVPLICACLLAMPLLASGCVGGGRPVGGGAVEAEPFSGDALNFIVLGDWGRAGFFNQREVAAQMGRTAEAIRSRFVISTGDNFYTTGVASTDDPKWLRSYEEIYTARSLWEPWYVVLGNHDWQGNPYAQIAYSSISPRWRMPDTYFTTRFRLDDDSTDVLIVYLDTTPLADFERADIYPMSNTWNQRAQLQWMDSTLAHSKAEWKIVVGHHPIIVGSQRYRDNPHLLRDVLPVLDAHGPEYDRGEVRTADQLDEDVIESGGQFTLHGIPCDKYDVRVVDEDGDACVIEKVPLCGASDEWTITDEDLLGCQVATEE